MEKNKIAVLGETKNKVFAQVSKYSEEKKLDLPQNYSVGNALTQFQLSIQDNDKIMACSQLSLAKCMLDMCVMGLNPAKKQCYVIPYGNKATLMPSYKGNMLLAKRIDPSIVNITARAVHKGEEFEFEDLSNGYSKIISHRRTLETMAVNDPMKDIVGAYATISKADGEELSLVMPFSEIVKRWKKSLARPFDEKGNLKPSSVHAQYPDKMAERTVINAICLPIVDSSDDSDLFGETVQTVSMVAQQAEMEAEVDENMCKGDFIDVDFEEENDDLDLPTEAIILDEETGELSE